MTDLEKKLRAIRRRLLLRRLVDWSAWGLVAGLVAVALVLLVRVFFPFQTDLLFMGATIVVAAMLTGAIGALFRGATLFEAALRADAHLGLHERLSSAWLLSQQRREREPSPALVTVMEDARQHAQAIHPRRDFRCNLPRHFLHGTWPALGIVVLLFVPSLPLFQSDDDPSGSREERTTRNTLTTEERTNIAEEIRRLAREERERRLDAGDAELDLNMSDRLERLARDLEMGNTDRLETMAELSRLNEEVQVKQRDADRERQPFRQLSGLQQAQQTRELQRSLKNGDFQKAAEQFDEIARKLQEMDEEDLQELAEELEQLANQLKENPGMAEALRDAAEAIQEMMEQNQQQGQSGEGQDSTDQAGQQAGTDTPGSDGEAGQQSAQQNQAMSQAMSQAMESLSQARDRSEGMEQLQRQVEQLAQMQQGLSECMGACAAGGGEGEDGQQMAGSMSQGSGGEGMGSGGPGRGQGGAPPEDRSAQVGFQDVFIPGDQHEGEIIAVFEGEGLVPAGESTLDYREVPMEVRQRAARSIEDTRIPAGHRSSVRDYFEAIHFNNEQD
ncbi:MAG: hypothetical protein JJU11_15955 [Candidatus Sumerlaeia bacterium]|nr:hypothetical protein [Candidatus Sumerlaeia bacterium]